MTRIFILGSTGMIGHKLFHFLSKEDSYDVIGASRTKYNKDTVLTDVRDLKSIKKELDNIKPDIVINCCGLLIEDSEKNIFDAITINSLLPHYLSDLSISQNYKLIHLSTDCVFSGQNGPYKEDDRKDAISIYGKTKSLGEIIAENQLTIRTSVIGPDLFLDGGELLHWFLTQGGVVDGYTESLWSGVTTLELAKSVKWSIENDKSGLRHLTSNKPISKYNLLKIINEHLNNKIKINKIEGPKHNKGLINSTNFYYDSDVSYQQIISEMFDDIKTNKDLYPHYQVG